MMEDVRTTRFDRCHNCNEWHYNTENCQPLFQVYIHDADGVGEYAHASRGYDHEDAAEKLLARYNAENEDFLINKSITVDCIRVDDGKRKRFAIMLEYTVTTGSIEEIEINEPVAP